MSTFNDGINPSSSDRRQRIGAPRRSYWQHPIFRANTECSPKRRRLRGLLGARYSHLTRHEEAKGCARHEEQEKVQEHQDWVAEESRGVKNEAVSFRGETKRAGEHECQPALVAVADLAGHSQPKTMELNSLSNQDKPCEPRFVQKHPKAGEKHPIEPPVAARYYDAN